MKERTTMLRPLTAAAVLLCAGPAVAHEWYTGYNTIESYPSPIAGGAPVHRSCCNTTDCREYDDVEEVAGGVWFKELDYVAPWSRIRPSPDGKWHACKMPSDEVPRCLFGPSPGF